jgi:hypothetical protein
VVTDTDTSNCGTCDNVCPGAVNARPTCAGGVCDTECVAPTMECEGGCVDVLTSVAHCGQCDRPCPTPVNATAVCVNGTCGSVCNAGHSLCAGACTNTDTDNENCGRCGKTCSGRKICVSGSCVNPNQLD